MKRYFGYIRVSTPKQSEGVSLEQQQVAIRTHAQKSGIEIIEWFEERQTAAKVGRGVFSKMLARLERGDAQGVVIHKIDRSARNLWDWAHLSKLFDLGIDIQFAHDSIDLSSRGGRLSADIMAIIAADYVRNLRDEVRKGFYGRLKQGLYPLPAPIGYLDQGKGRPKLIDPERAPLIRYAFDRYGTGMVGLKALRKELQDVGLRSRQRKPLSLASLSLVLNNPFYAGLIRIRKTNETFEGVHEALVPVDVFDRVQTILRGKTVARPLKHDFVFRRLIECQRCGRHLVGELQKGHVYYRCQSDRCKGTILRGIDVDDLIEKRLKLLVGDERELREIGDMVEAEQRHATEGVEQFKAAANLLLAKCDDRRRRLTDALIDGLIDKQTYELRNIPLLSERKTLLRQIEGASEKDLPRHQALKSLELGNAAYLSYKMANSDERRLIVNQFISNLSVSGKYPAITLKSPFQEIAEWRKSQNGAPYRARPYKRARELLAIITAIAPASESTSVPNSATEKQRVKDARRIVRRWKNDGEQPRP